MLKINIISKYLLKKLYESTTIGKFIFDTNAKNWQTIEIAKYIGNLYILLRSVYAVCNQRQECKFIFRLNIWYKM